MIMLLVCFIILCISYYVVNSKKKFSYWKKRRVPHPPFSTFFGNISESIFLKKNLGQIMDDIYKAYPNLPYVGIYKIREPTLLIRDPKLVNEILVKDFPSFYANDIDIDKDADYLMAKNPFFSNGTEWKTSRGQLAPSFTNHKMKSIFPLMESVCQNFVDHLEDPTVANVGTNIKTLCEKYTMDVVALSVLGLEANSFKSVDNDYLTNIKKIIAPGYLMAIKLTILLVIPALAKIFKLKLSTSHSVYKRNIIKNALNYRQQNGIIRNDFLQTMQELQQKLGKDEFSDNHITAHTLSFFIDGYETSSIVLTFLLYEIGANIEHQNKLREEIENALKNGNGKFIFELIHDMVYLNNFLNESMRLHSPVFILTKRCTKPYMLPPVDNNSKEVLIEPGTPVFIPVHSIHYDSQYFPNSEKFDPERFSGENELTKSTFLPFSEGPRKCIGQKFAIAQIKVVIAHLVLNYDIRVNPKTRVPLEIDPAYFLLTAKGGIWLNFFKRKN
ncbi:hypothetical protein FQR65_LT11724 [Abscondita terminalis]|nr:hypothetical protein FQR65_LT11724 [Abscondita terminalis]